MCTCDYAGIVHAWYMCTCDYAGVFIHGAQACRGERGMSLASSSMALCLLPGKQGHSLAQKPAILAKLVLTGVLQIPTQIPALAQQAVIPTEPPLPSPSL